MYLLNQSSMFGFLLLCPLINLRGHFLLFYFKILYMQLQIKRFIYGLLYSFPRAILDILAALFVVITIGWYNPTFNYYKMYKHSCWADKIAKKYSGIENYLKNYKNEYTTRHD